MMKAPDDSRAWIYRLLFALAGVYNLAVAAWAIARPQAFPGLATIDMPRHLAIWRGLGMATGLFGLGYACAAWRLDRAAPIIAFGLLGKTLGAIGWVAMVRAGEWPIRTFTFVLFDSLVWWLPFGLFLLEGTRIGARLRASAPYLCAALNLAAVLAMLLVLSPGLETVHDQQARAAYIGAHPVLWRAGWIVWSAAALSLVGFYGWWAARVRSRPLAIAALILAIAGIVGDLLAESLYIGWLPDGGDRIATTARLLAGVGGNTLYAVAGALLTLGSAWLRGPARAIAWLIWSAGVALGGFSLAGYGTGMAVSMALLFALFCPWAAWMGIRDRRRPA